MTKALPGHAWAMRSPVPGRRLEAPHLTTPRDQSSPIRLAITYTRSSPPVRWASSKLRRLTLTTYLCPAVRTQASIRSEEHTSELQSRLHLVCRLLLEKTK